MVLDSMFVAVASPGVLQAPKTSKETKSLC
jgi:hypothetical protein